MTREEQLKAKAAKKAAKEKRLRKKLKKIEKQADAENTLARHGMKAPRHMIGKLVSPKQRRIENRNAAVEESAQTRRWRTKDPKPAGQKTKKPGQLR